MTLSNKQKQHLKGLAHAIKPVVQLGNNGLTEGVLSEIIGAIKHHELIKVKIPTDDKEEKTLIIDAIVRETNAFKIQAMGHILVLFKQSDEKKVELPKK